MYKARYYKADGKAGRTRELPAALFDGVVNEGVGKPPSVYEQGREYTELSKVKGKWMISRRFISSDSGLPDRFDATWKPREHR